ncbi:MAG: hypothetical protein H6502_02900 [Candidatus Woesearchaeota archaeon]|nr:MAG: hypothetical protein H6502_02900 [Candidatus Woesearchaeota archaeon]
MATDRHLAEKITRGQNHAKNLNFAAAFYLYEEILAELEQTTFANEHNKSEVEVALHQLYSSLVLKQTIDNAHLLVDTGNIQELRAKTTTIKKLINYLGGESKLKQFAEQNATYFSTVLRQK